MYSGFLITLIVALVFLGLCKSTENVLAIRQKRRDRGDDPSVYL